MNIKYNMNDTLEVILPHNKKMLTFLGMRMQDREKCVELGMNFLSHGNQLIQYWDNNQWEQKMKRIQTELEMEKSQNNKLIQMHNEEKKIIGNMIRTSIETQYKGESHLLYEKINSLEGKLGKEVDKYHNLASKTNERI